MVSPRDPKIAQNHQKLCSRGLPESTLQKVTKNYAIWKGQTSEFADTYTLSAVFPVAQGPQKGAQKPPKMEPLGTQNHRKNRKTNTQKTHQKMDAKTIKKGAKKGLPLSWRRGLQNHKNPSLGLKMCPKPPGGVPRHPKYPKIIKKRAPRASKIAQHHENLITQNQENPRKKSRKKDAARWRVMRAAHWISFHPWINEDPAKKGIGQS